MAQIKNLSKMFINLPDDAKNELFNKIEKVLLQEVNKNVNSIQSDNLLKTGPKCPSCGSMRFRLNGSQQNKQLYKCKDCGRNFRQTSGTVLSWLKKPEKIKDYLSHMLMGYSIKKCAELTGISIQTSFDWRHKLLSGLIPVLDDLRFSGIVETGKVVLPYKEGQSRFLRNIRVKKQCHPEKEARKFIFIKKVSILNTIDRYGNSKLQHINNNENFKKKDIFKELYGKINRESIICTMKNRSFTSFIKDCNIQHIKISRTPVIKGLYHLNNLKNSESELKVWLSGFKGVSPKYLQNYLNWFALNKKILKNIVPETFMLELSSKSRSAWHDYKKMQHNANNN